MNAPVLDRTELREVLDQADIRVLLMVLVHLTGDRAWLAPPFSPMRDARLIPDPQAGLPEDVQAKVRRTAFDMLSSGSPRPVIRDPGNTLLQEMMSVCLGEVVPAEYAPMVREEMGLVSKDPVWKSSKVSQAAQSHFVLIVGAGVSGLALAVRLGRLGIPYRIVEKSDALGGTWRVNRYPGCGVDTPNHSYSFSFGQRYPWSRYFSRREEIEDYLNKIGDEFALRPNISFRTRLTQARWDSEKHKWIALIESERGEEEIQATLLVTAVGQLSEPTIPPLEGREEFEGVQLHSADWSDGTKISGKSVAIIGTGASSMQIVPTIADSVHSVTIYQRTPQWARPIAGYSDLINEGTQWLLQHVPFYAEWFRFNMFWRYGDSLLPFLKKDPAWPHKTRSINRGNERHREELIDYIKSELANRSDLIGNSIPNYPPFGKRILLDNGWYRALLKPNVNLVVNAIDHIEKNAIATVDGIRRPTDVIIWATGFDLSQLAARLNIKGLNGMTLEDEWNGDPKAYLGIAVPGFPNFFCMLGPNSGLGHGGSTIFQSECQARYISSCIVSMVEDNIDAINVRRDAYDVYVRKVDAEHEQMIWTHPGMTTYYRNKSGRVFSVMPWRLVDYWSMTHDPDLNQFELSKRDTAV